MSFTRKTYLCGLLTALAFFYLPLILAIRSPSGLKTLAIAPLAAAVETVPLVFRGHSQAVLTCAIQFLLIGLVIAPLRGNEIGRKRVFWALLGWAAFLATLTWSFVTISSGA